MANKVKADEKKDTTGRKIVKSGGEERYFVFQIGASRFFLLKLG